MNPARCIWKKTEFNSVDQFSGHFFAFLSAMLACFSTFAAMFHVVLATFLGATTANFRAMPANMRGLLRISRHQFGGHRANQCAIQIQFDAARQVLNHFFAETSARAMFALHRAIVASVNAALIFFV
jgi:hypothetical protein